MKKVEGKPKKMDGSKSCEEWLRGILQGGRAQLCDEVRVSAKKAGYTRAELKEARKCLGVKTFHQFDEAGATNNWFWYLGGAGCERT